MAPNPERPKCSSGNVWLYSKVPPNLYGLKQLFVSQGLYVEWVHLDILVWGLSSCCMEAEAWVIWGLNWVRLPDGLLAWLVLILLVGYWMWTQLEQSTSGPTHGLSLGLGLHTTWCLGFWEGVSQQWAFQESKENTAAGILMTQSWESCCVTSAAFYWLHMASSVSMWKGISLGCEY